MLYCLLNQLQERYAMVEFVRELRLLMEAMNRTTPLAIAMMALILAIIVFAAKGA